MNEFNTFKKEINGKSVIIVEATSNVADVVTSMIKNETSAFGNYSLEKVTDNELIKAWVEVAKEDGEEERSTELQNALDKGACIYTLEDHLGDVHQTICEVIIY